MEGWLDCAASPQRVYDCLTDYAGLADTFSNISATEVVREDGRLQVKQMCSWKFLVFSGTFSLLLHVREEPERMALTFDLMESAFMNSFLGVWTVCCFECCSKCALDGFITKTSCALRWCSSLCTASMRLGFCCTHQATLQVTPLPGGGCRVYHRQQVRPALAPPAVVGMPPMQRLSQLTGAAVLCDAHRCTLSQGSTRSPYSCGR